MYCNKVTVPVHYFTTFQVLNVSMNFNAMIILLFGGGGVGAEDATRYSSAYLCEKNAPRAIEEEQWRT